MLNSGLRPLQRVMRHPERLLAALVGVIVIASLLSMGWMATTRLARRKINEQLVLASKRAGVPIEIGNWKLGLGAVHFEDIVVGAQNELVASMATAEAVLNPFSPRFGKIESFTVERLQIKVGAAEFIGRARTLALASDEADKGEVAAREQKRGIEKLFAAMPVDRLWLKSSAVSLLDADGATLAQLRGLRLLIDRRATKVLFRLDSLRTQNALADKNLQGRLQFDPENTESFRFFVRKKRQNGSKLNDWALSGRLARDLTTADVKVSIRSLPSLIARAARPILGDNPKLALDGRITAKRSTTGTTSFKVQLASRGSRATVPLISTQPVGPIFFELDANGELREDDGLFTLEQASITVPPRRDAEKHSSPVRFLLSGGGRYTASTETKTSDGASLQSSPPSLASGLANLSWQGHLRLVDNSCQSLIDAAPSGLVPALMGFKLGGSAGMAVSFALSGDKPDSLTFNVTDARYHCTVNEAPFSYSAQHLSGPFTLTRQDADEKMSVEIALGPKAPGFTPLDHIARSVNQAFIAAEDASFFNHKGIDSFALENAARRNFSERRVAVGGSTITMQTVKNLFLSHERTVSRKLQELFLAWHLEKVLAKDKILELYLNIVEFGPGIYGITRASEHFFAKLPHELSLSESAYLAMLLPSPKQRYRYFCDGRLTPAFRDSVSGLLKRMVTLGRISPDRYAQAAGINLRFNEEMRLSSRACERHHGENADVGS